MKDFKNLLILTLTALLGLSLFIVVLQTKHTHPAPIAPKTYDAVKLLNYEKCLDRFSNRYWNWNGIDKEADNGPNGKSPSRVSIALCQELLQ